MVQTSYHMWLCTLVPNLSSFEQYIYGRCILINVREVANITCPPPMKSGVAVLRALVLLATSQKIVIWPILKRKIIISWVKTKNNSLQSCRQWKDAQVSRRWVHDSKIFHVFCAGLTQKTPILGYLSTSSHLNSKKIVASQETLV